VTNGQIVLTFAARAGQSYAVETSAVISLSNNWSTLTNFAAPLSDTNFTVFDSMTLQQRFYRLRLP
jgi:hypothetical protein